MEKTYTRINWENEPSLHSPINDVNLNKMDSAIDVIDSRVVTFDTTKANQSDLLTAVKSIAFNGNTGVFTITFMNNTTATIDTDFEKIVTNFDYDDDPTSAHYQNLILTLEDGTIKYVDMSALLTQYEFTNTSTIAFTVGNDGKVSANVVDGSITADKLQPNYLADVTAQASAASASAGAAALSATAAGDDAEDSEAWAVGQRAGQDVPSTDETYHNNAKYWAGQAQQAAGGGVTSFNGRSGAVTPASGDYKINQISPTNGATTGQIPVLRNDGTAQDPDYNFHMEDPLGGHTIVDRSGSNMTARSKLQFTGSIDLTDDSTNDQTVVRIPGVYFGTSATPASNINKTVSILTPGFFNLMSGTIVCIKFTYDVQAGATLNIDGTGAYYMYQGWTQEIGDGVIKGGDMATFIFETANNRYRLIAVDRANTEFETAATTCGIGDTTVTISDNRITANSLCLPIGDNTSGGGLYIKTVVASSGSCTVTFEALEEATDISLLVR